MIHDFVLVALIVGAGERAMAVRNLEDHANFARACYWTGAQQDLLRALLG